MVGNRNDAGWVTLSAPTPRVDQPLEAVLSDPDGDTADVVWRWEMLHRPEQLDTNPRRHHQHLHTHPQPMIQYLRVTATYR